MTFIQNIKLSISEVGKLGALRNITLLLYSYFVFVYFSMLSNPTALEYLIYLLGIAYTSFYLKKIFFTPPFIFCVLIALIPTLSWLLMEIQHSELNPEMLGLREYLRMAFFLPLALMLRGDMRWIKIIIASFIAGVALAPWVSGGIEGVVDAFSGSRLAFHRNPIRAGILLTVAIIFLFFYVNVFFNKRNLYVGLVSFIVFLSYLLIMMFLTQSRSAVFALVLALVAGIFVFLYAEEWRPFKKYFPPAAIVCFFVVLLGSYFVVKLGLADKTLPEIKMVLSVLSEGREAIPNTSWGYRLQMWLLGLESFLERPLLGWGNMGGDLVMSISGISVFERHFDQLHSAHIELLVRYGVLYVISIWAAFYWVGLTLYRARYSGVIGPAFFYVFVVCLFFYFFANFFGSFLVRSDTERLFPIFFGISSSLYFSKLIPLSESSNG